MELDIEQVVYPGKGLARPDGRAVFVRGALEGEKVRVRVVREKARFAEAELVEVLEPSVHRVPAACPLAAQCPGCSYQHVTYEEEIRIKQKQLQGMLCHALAAPDEIFATPFPSPSPLGYRNRITLHAQVREGLPSLGYYGPDNRTVLDVRHCPLADDALNKLLRDLRTKPAFMNALRDDNVLQLCCTPTDGAVGRIRAGKRWIAVDAHSETEDLTLTTSYGTLAVPFGGFFQVNRPVADEVLRRFCATLRDLKPEYVVDLYAGIGPFAFAAAQNGVPHVLGVERDRRAVRTAQKNAESLGLPQCEFWAKPAERAIAAALSPVDQEGCVVVLNPPRRGLEKETLQTLCDAGPNHLVYISCAPDILVRDLRPLIGSGYRLRACALFDMFARTATFETMCVLERDAKKG